jgi:hypothetical protein
LIEEGLLSQVAGDLWTYSLGLHALGKVRLSQGEHAQAQALFAKGLAQARRLGDQRGISQCLEGVAAVAVVHGRATDAIQLFAAADALREAIGAPLP